MAATATKETQTWCPVSSGRASRRPLLALTDVPPLLTPAGDRRRASADCPSRPTTQPMP